MTLLTQKDMPSDFVSNRCGGENWLGSLVPDKPSWADFGEACHIHDYDYTKGGSQEDKEMADVRFLANMLIIIKRDDTWYTSESDAREWAYAYFLAVIQFGHEHFNYTDGEEHG